MIKKLTVIFQGHSAPVYEEGTNGVNKISFSTAEGGTEFKVQYDDERIVYIGAREYIAEV